MITENIKATGLVSFVLKDEFGNVKSQQDRNLVVNSGLAFIAQRMAGTTPAAMSHMSIGTGTTAAAAAQTGLVTEVSRKSLTSTTVVTTTASNDSVQYVASFGPGEGTGALTEAGLFNASSGGSMLARVVYPVINKGALDSLTITWKVTIA